MKAALFLFLILTLTACAPLTALPTAPPSPTSPPIFPASSSDPELDEAILSARATLDQFIALLDSPNPTREFAALKVRFAPTDSAPLDIWRGDVTYAAGQFTGNMGDDILPASLLW
jgi:hypothetical protein